MYEVAKGKAFLNVPPGDGHGPPTPRSRRGGFARALTPHGSGRNESRSRPQKREDAALAKAEFSKSLDRLLSPPTIRNSPGRVSRVTALQFSSVPFPAKKIKRHKKK